MPRKHHSVDLGEIGSGLHVFAETFEVEIASNATMLAKFNSQIEDNEPMTARYIGKSLNPEVRDAWGDMHRAFGDQDTWVYVFRRNFYVLVQKHSRLVSGPHVGKLMYQSYQTKQRFWIATVQIIGMFYSEETMDIQVFDAVFNRRWFCAERSLKDKVAL